VSAPSPRPKRSLLRRLVLATCGLLIGLVFLELGIRIVAPQGLITEFFRYEATATGGPDFRLQPGLWIPGEIGGSVNRMGLRGPEIPGKSTATRVLVLGDSFVYGAGVSTAASLPAQLQERADSDPTDGPGYEFINGGTPSYGTARELAWLEFYGDQIDPDEVLLGVFVGNDFTDNLEVEPPAIVAGRLFFGAAANASETQKLWRVLANKSHLARLLRRRSFSSGGDSRAEPATVSQPPGTAEQQVAREALLQKFAKTQVGRLSIYVPERGLDPRVDIAYDMTQLSLEGIAAWCAGRGIGLSLVLIPDVLQVEPDVRERALGQADEVNFIGDFARPQRELLEWCKHLGLEAVDVVGPLSSATQERGESFYLFGDSHWNADGHALSAELVYDSLYADLSGN
jgi:lysophospholipase L1-like esterase